MNVGSALAPYLGLRQEAGPVQAQLPDGRRLQVQGWLPDQPAAGQPLDILLQWQLSAGAQTGAEAWPPELAAFVHLRRNGENIVQADGAPQMFGRPSPLVAPSSELKDTAFFLNDWRQVTSETACTVEAACQVVAGVYNPGSGERLALRDATGAAIGDEFVLGTLTIGPASVPDQACALTGACE
jgi:hypothetical protein